MRLLAIVVRRGYKMGERIGNNVYTGAAIIALSRECSSEIIECILLGSGVFDCAKLPAVQATALNLHCWNNNLTLAGFLNKGMMW